MPQIALELVMWRAREAPSQYGEAFASLVHRQSRLVFRVAYSVLRNAADAEDAGQEAFLKLYRSRAWRNAKDERAFLARVVWRIAVDKARHSRRKPVGAGVGIEARNPEQLFADANRLAMLQRWIEALPEDLRHPLTLSTVEELTSAQIGEILDIPEGTVRSRLNRAREILKQKAAVVLERRT